MQGVAKKGWVIAVTVAMLLLPAAAPAGAAITVGSGMTGTVFGNANCNATNCTSINSQVAGPNPLTSPISGVIVRWRFGQGMNAGETDVALRVVTPMAQIFPQ